MSSANAIVQYLLDTRQQTAVGIGHLLQALLVNTTKPAAKPPITVEHTNKEGAIRVMLFSRPKLTTTFSSAVDNMKYDLGIAQRGYYNQVAVTITGGLFYNEDGTVQETSVLIAQESWADLMPHVHKIFIRTVATA